MAIFKDALETYFPEETTYNIGQKTDFVKINIYLNNFLYNILSDTPAYQDQIIMRESFSLNDNGPNE